MMDADVLVFGGGVAGLTAAVLAARSGLEVVCVDPKRFPRRPVGESLDWSAPRLLAALGLPRDDLVAAGIGTYKREVRAFTAGGERLVGRPPGGLDRWPLRFDRVTIHLDRERFDQALYEQALDSGVRFVGAPVRTGSGQNPYGSRIFVVGATGIEPVTSAVSRHTSPYSPLFQTPYPVPAIA